MVSGRRLPRWTRFVRTYGWRAYALPILAVITIAVLIQPAVQSSAARTSTATTRGSVTRHQLVEGAGSADYLAGAQPKPVVVQLEADSTSCVGNDYAKYLVVSIKRQHLWACHGQTQVRSTPVTTGKLTADHRTPLGSWRVQAKQRDRYLIGAGYKDYVRYWVPFNGDFGFHDASWQTMAFGSPDYVTRGSHGCVHLPTATMAWLYHWTSVDSTVVTIEA